jgi:hypothetical protein
MNLDARSARTPSLLADGQPPVSKAPGAARLRVLRADETNFVNFVSVSAHAGDPVSRAENAWAAGDHALRVGSERPSLCSFRHERACRVPVETDPQYPQIQSGIAAGASSGRDSGWGWQRGRKTAGHADSATTRGHNRNLLRVTPLRKCAYEISAQTRKSPDEVSPPGISPYSGRSTQYFVKYRVPTNATHHRFTRAFVARNTSPRNAY